MNFRVFSIIGIVSGLIFVGGCSIPEEAAKVVDPGLARPGSTTFAASSGMLHPPTKMRPDTMPMMLKTLKFISASLRRAVI